MRLVLCLIKLKFSAMRRTIRWVRICKEFCGSSLKTPRSGSKDERITQEAWQSCLWLVTFLVLEIGIRQTFCWRDRLVKLYILTSVTASSLL